MLRDELGELPLVLQTSPRYCVGKHQLSGLPLKAIGLQSFIPSGQSAAVVQSFEHTNGPSPAMHTPLSQSSSLEHG